MTREAGHPATASRHPEGEPTECNSPRRKRDKSGESVAQLAPSGCPGAQALRAALELSGADGKEEPLEAAEHGVE